MSEENKNTTNAQEVSAEDKEKAEGEKKQGNAYFKQMKYIPAIDHYSAAIAIDPTNAVYFSNRSVCHLRLENYGYALDDATKAIAANKRYIKGYYRRGAANLAMGKYKAALKDFKQVQKVAPGNKDAKKKVRECQKIIREDAFSKAIEGDKPDIKKLTVPADYTGPKLGKTVTKEFVTDLMEHFQNQKLLPVKYVYQIVMDVTALLDKTPTIVDISVPEGTEITVCGDVHGQYYDVLNLFKINGVPSETNPYLFNGDFVDRGSFSLEIMLVFFCFKLLYPNHFHLMRGNHETRTMNQIYGFKGEVIHKADAGAFELFSDAFDVLPLGAVIGEKVLVVHGGLFSEDGVKLDDLRKINRKRQPPESGLMCEILWSDPQEQKGRSPSKRGVGLSFGPDVTARFLKDNNLEMIVRSHEVKEEGYHVEANGQLVTIFSAPNYCDSMGNKAAFIRFGSDMKPKYTQYTAVQHPPVAPMAYAQQMFQQQFS